MLVDKEESRDAAMEAFATSPAAYKRPGIEGLRSISGSSDIGVTELGFRIGPRINAAGRTGSPELGS